MMSSFAIAFASSVSSPFASSRTPSRAWVIASVCALLGCAGPAEHEHDPVTRIAFEARMGDDAFACGRTYALGSPATTYRPRDFRLYVHDVRLLSTDGDEVPFVLSDDAVWQREGVALLDFEDASAECANGTSATNKELRGEAPGGHYFGIALTIGVPFAQNHQDATAALPPLNTTAMFWSWMGGYKFLKIDGATAGLPAGHNLHLGSTSCKAGDAPNVVASCDNPNRVSVRLDVFDPERHAVAIDPARVFETSNLDLNQSDTPPGCMSGPSDADCAPIFARLSLPFPGSDVQAQALMRVVERAGGE